MENEKKEFTGVWIPRHIIEDNDLSMTDKIIYSEIACFNTCYKSNEKLGERYNLKADTISRVIGRLILKKYIKKVSFDGRNRALQALRDEPVLSRVGKKSYTASEKIPTIDNILENKDIYIADKSAKVNKLTNLYEQFGLPVNVKTFSKWQEEAANAIKLLKDINGKESSIFKCFKEDNHHAKLALSDCKELSKYNVLYFLKVYSELRKK